MESQEQVTAQNIVKGKRTKRQRVQSPIPFSLTTNSSSGDDSGGGGGGDHDGNRDGDDDNDDTTEEEEDMANCLILLAQGQSLTDSLRKQKDNDSGARINTINVAKFNSRRFLETGSQGSGKVGYYVYECKTCSRTFPSFQALGGHRASHKKPKMAVITNNNNNNDDNKAQLTPSSDEDEDGHFRNISSLSLMLGNNASNYRGVYYNNRHESEFWHNKKPMVANQNKSKIHECSVCGAEFTSGQALGGHMRRHRGPIGAASGTNLSLTPLAIESEQTQKARNPLSLDLDLNLPAPEDDKSIHFASKQQQQQQQQKSSPLVFSSPALVDCHY